MKTTSEIQSLAKEIRLVILDVDGVLTDGTLSYTGEGEQVKHFNVKDGLGIRLLITHGIDVAIITARESAPLKRRVQDLGIKYFYPGQDNKLTAYSELLGTLDLTPQQVAYVGDDALDIPVMRQVGLAISVSDGHELVKEDADWVTESKGGHGAVREVADMLLASRMPLREAYDLLLSSSADDRRSKLA